MGLHPREQKAVTMRCRLERARQPFYQSFLIIISVDDVFRFGPVLSHTRRLLLLGVVRRLYHPRVKAVLPKCLALVVIVI